LFIGEVALLGTDFPVVTVEHDWNASLGVNALEEVIYGEEACFVIILYGETSLDRIRKPLKGNTPAFHRRLSFSESSAKMNVDCRVRSPRETHDVHNLPVNSQVFNRIQNYALTERAEAVELTWMKRDTLIGAPSNIASLLKERAKLIPLWQLLELILRSPRNHVGRHPIDLDAYLLIPLEDAAETLDIFNGKVTCHLLTVGFKSPLNHGPEAALLSKGHIQTSITEFDIFQLLSPCKSNLILFLQRGKEKY
jgi:hypothetical protein